MKKENKLVKKVAHLLKKANAPRWLHRFGPKTYDFLQHAVVLIVKQECKMGYRRATSLLQSLGLKVPTYSAVAKMNKRIPFRLLTLLLAATIGFAVVNIAAIDGTTFTRSNPSHHYLQRIDRNVPVGRPVKLSILVDTRRKKIISAWFRSKPRGDVKDIPKIIKHLVRKPRMIVADKGYDSEDVHSQLRDQGINTLIPLRKNARKGFYRRQMKKSFNTRVYHRREIVESVFATLKQKYGCSVRCTKARMQRAEIYFRLIAHNISTLIFRLFQRSHKMHNFYILITVML